MNLATANQRNGDDGAATPSSRSGSSCERPASGLESVRKSTLSATRASRPHRLAGPVRTLALLALVFAIGATFALAASPLVLQTDFGQKDGAVAAMKGVAVSVSPQLAIYDLSHENTPYDIWEAAYRLKQTASFWPAGTVFVSVIDPGVGTERKAVVLKTKSGHFFVGPDNGTWTLIAEDLGVEAMRRIDETRHRRHGSENSHTFHGRDIFAYVGAELAAGVTTFDDVGPLLEPKVVALAYERPRLDGTVLTGTIPTLDFQYGNVWTNLDEALFARLSPKTGDRFRVLISKSGVLVYEGAMPYVRTFGDVPEGQPLLYLNSLMNVSFALNQGDFAKTRHIASGGEWRVRVEKEKP
ncbi:MAG: acetolactate synthase [Verrucomicrobia bacterium]|nr:acetolactate synthase [Verrucomicrobiota bacterium]